MLRNQVTIACVGFLLAAACGPAGDGPDRILYNARIWTGDSAQPEAEALAITGDRIVAVGTSREVRALRGRDTRMEDMRGLRVVPGLHDAHLHLPTRRVADLVGAADTLELIARLRDFAAGLPDDAWLLGRGWTQVLFQGGAPHRGLLDAAFPDRPVLITDRDGHQVLANSRALALAGVTRATPEPVGGTIVRETDGTPTGLLQEGPAMQLVRGLVPAPGPEEVEATLRAELQAMAALGLTAIQVASEPVDAQREAAERLAAADSLPVRIRFAIPFSATLSDTALAIHFDRHRHANGPYLRYGVAKGVVDGTIDAGTAAMLEPYAIGGGRGTAMWEQEALNRRVAHYHLLGFQVQLHAIGDRAIRMALDAFQYTREQNLLGERRHRIEHLEVPAPADLPRFAELGVIASTQAIFATPDATTLENYVPRLGPERAARAMPFRALDDAGAIQAFGSDYPVFPASPLLGIYTAVTRQLPDGTPPGGSHPEHRISVSAALRHYTWGSAYAAFRDHELGRLAPGMLADLVVLSEDVLQGPPTTLLEARVLLTVMGGRDTFRAEP